MEKIILVDTSGSMGEVGKKSVIKYSVLAITDYLKNAIKDDYSIFSWNDQIQPFDFGFETKKEASASALKAFVEEHKTEDILLLSDGGYSETSKSLLKQLDGRLKILMIGSECNRARLQRITSRENIYETADVITCLDSFICM